MFSITQQRLFSQFCFFCLLFFYLSHVESVAIDNSIVGEPVVECSTSAITIRVSTRRPFGGRIFVKGMSRFAQCTHDYSALPVDTNVAMTVPLGGCEMKRNRMLQPNGLQQGLTVIVSFHPVFITKVDRAFNLRCFFLDAEKLLTHHFQVSMLTTRDIYRESSLPNCEYTVRRNSPNGPLVRYASVGEKLYHVWRCDSNTNMGLLVRNCIIEDGSRLQFISLDQAGCPTDVHVMGYLTYSEDLSEAYVETHAFKFADDVNLYFKCEITLCSLTPVPGVGAAGESTCLGVSPPVCDGRQRSPVHQTLQRTNPDFPSSEEDQDNREKRDLSEVIQPIPALPNPNKTKHMDMMVLDMSPKNDFVILDPLPNSNSDQQKDDLSLQDELTEVQSEDSPSNVAQKACEVLQQFPYVLSGFAILGGLVVVAFIMISLMMIMVCRHEKRTYHRKPL